MLGGLLMVLYFISGLILAIFLIIALDYVFHRCGYQIRPLLTLSIISVFLGGALSGIVLNRGSILIFTMDRKEMIPRNIKAFICALVASLAIYLILFVIFAWKSKKQTLIWDSVYRHRFYFFCGGLSLLYLYLLLRYSSIRSLWWDDMCQLGMNWHVGSISELFQNNLSGDNMPPLYHLFAALWLRVAPYGTFWLKLPSEIAVAAGVYVCGLCGNHLKGARLGLLTSLFAILNINLINFGAYVFRSYGFYFLFAALTVYAYIRRLKQGYQASWGSIVLFGISMLLLSYTHYFGILLCGSLFLGDLFLWIFKKARIRTCLSYALAAAGFLPWGIYALPYILARTQSFWPEPPTLKSLKTTLEFLSGDKLILIFIAVIITMLGLFLFHIWKKQLSFENHFPWVIQLWSLLFVIGCVYIYSAYLKPTASAYVDRYFFCLLPSMFLLLAWGIDKIFKGVSSLSQRKDKVFPYVFSGLIVLTAIYSIYPKTLSHLTSSDHNRYEQYALWLDSHVDVYETGTAFVFAQESGTVKYAMKGWQYYLTRDGDRPLVQTLEPNDLDKDSLEKYNTLYFFEVHTHNMSECKYDLLEKNGFTNSANYPDLNLKVYTRTVDS